MGEKTKQDISVENGVTEYELKAPDGGWGYMIVFATVIIFSTTIIPMTAFGLIFGNFLKSIGDETTGTTLSNGMFNTVNSFTGLLANGLLNRFSYRKVGFGGAIIYLGGATGLIFCQNLFQLILFFGVIQGVGFGLMMPASLSAFNSYFNEKMAVMMSICQAAMIICGMLLPQVATWSVETFGFRWTLVGLLGMASLCLPAMATLQPVKWHMKKVPVESSTINDTVVSVDTSSHRKESLPPNILKTQVEPLLNQSKHFTVSQKSLHERIIHPAPRRSIISLGDRVASVTTINDLRDEDGNKRNASKEVELSMWQSFIKSMDMSLLKDAKYLNMSIGLALCFTSDMAFISIIPLMLRNVGFDSSQIALIVTVYFGSDLASRILFTVVSGIFKFRSRVVVLFAAIFSAIFRTVLVFNDTYMWKMSVLAILGFLRCLIQTPLPLVISEEYQDKFSTAFSLWMAVNGVISLVFGLLMSFIKSYTQSDAMVCHSLTMAFSICVIAWIAEMTLCRKKPERSQKK